MWANNEVGTLQPIDEVVALAAAARHPRAHRRDPGGRARCPVDFAASGVDADDADRAQGRWPVRRRRARRTPRARGHRDAARRRPGARHPLRHARRAGDRRLRGGGRGRRQAAGRARRADGRAARPSWSPRCIAAVPDAHRQRRTPTERLPGNAHLRLPRLRGRLAADAARRPRHRVLDRVGLLGGRRPALPRADGDGHATRRTRSARCASPSATPAPTPTSTPSSRRSGPCVDRARASGSRWCADVQVVAAMSGGVDSAVAAARAVEAGHDVTGIHLALSRNPASYRSGARGCCTLEDAHDARRAADVIGIPFYVWDLSERFHEDVVEDFMDEYAAGRTPNPCLRCNEKIKFAAVLDRALGLGFDAVATGHYAQLRTGGRRHCRAAPRRGRRQGPVLRARRAHPGPAARTRCSRSATRQAGGTPRGRAPRAAGGRQAGLPRHLLRRRRRQRRLAAREARRPGAQPRRRHRRRRHRRGAGPARRAPTRFTIGQRKGLRIGRPAPDGKPRFVLDIEPVSGHRPRRPARGA